MRNGAFAVAAGIYDMVLTCGVEKLKDHAGGFTSLHYPVEWSRVDPEFPPVNFFAKVAMRYFHTYGLSLDEGKRLLAKIAVKNHQNGAKHPKAHLRREINEDMALRSPMISAAFPSRVSTSAVTETARRLPTRVILE